VCIAMTGNKETLLTPQRDHVHYAHPVIAPLRRLFFRGRNYDI